MAAQTCAVSVDLDEITHYAALHGLSESALDPGALGLVYDRALDRIEDFARAHDLPVTLFAVGVELDRKAAEARLRALSNAGHAVENHSLSHRYDLTRLAPDAIAREIGEGARAIERATGRAPTGFRAPGYAVNDPLFDALEQLGVAWDSSVFPCPSYHAAKTLVLARMRLRGASSSSIATDPAVFLAPSRPYRPGRSWFRRGRRAFVELPIQVTPHLRLPVIGTSLALARPEGALALAWRLAREPFVNLELHGIDFLGEADGLGPLAPFQPELRVPLGMRLEAVSAFLGSLAGRGFSFVRLDEAARVSAFIK